MRPDRICPVKPTAQRTVRQVNRLVKQAFGPNAHADIQQAAGISTGIFVRDKKGRMLAHMTNINTDGKPINPVDMLQDFALVQKAHQAGLLKTKRVGVGDKLGF